MDEIAKQAHQGSVAAIVQIMNDRLTDMGVRTRAVLEKGILQILCEAQESEQLKQSVLIPQLREILEAIAPRNLRRVNICSRIAREQQLVWLEDIHRNPENQVLWSQEIFLRKPNILQKWLARGHRNPPNHQKSNAIVTSPSENAPENFAEKNERMLNIFGMVGLCTVSFLAGLAYNSWQEQNLDWSQWSQFLPAFNSSVSSVSPAAPISQPETLSNSNPPSPSPLSTPKTPESATDDTTDDVVLPTPSASKSLETAKEPQDPFVEAVKLAEAVSLKGQTAQTEAEWLELSTQWKKASELMKSVSADDSRYNTARDRVVFYQKNSEVALARAKEQKN